MSIVEGPALNACPHRAMIWLTVFPSYIATKAGSNDRDYGFRFKASFPNATAPTATAGIEQPVFLDESGER